MAINIKSLKQMKTLGSQGLPVHIAEFIQSVNEQIFFAGCDNCYLGRIETFRALLHETLIDEMQYNHHVENVCAQLGDARFISLIPNVNVQNEIDLRLKICQDLRSSGHISIAQSKKLYVTLAEKLEAYINTQNESAASSGTSVRHCASELLLILDTVPDVSLEEALTADDDSIVAAMMEDPHYSGMDKAALQRGIRESLLSHRTQTVVVPNDNVTDGSTHEVAAVEQIRIPGMSLEHKETIRSYTCKDPYPFYRYLTRPFNAPNRQPENVKNQVRYLKQLMSAVEAMAGAEGGRYLKIRQAYRGVKVAHNEFLRRKVEATLAADQADNGIINESSSTEEGEISNVGANNVAVVPYRVGDLFTQAAFTSVSTRSAVAEGFSDGLVFQYECFVGVSIRPLSAYPDEEEILIPPPSVFRVKHVLVLPIIRLVVVTLEQIVQEGTTYKSNSYFHTLGATAAAAVPPPRAAEVTVSPGASPRAVAVTNATSPTSSSEIDSVPSTQARSKFVKHKQSSDKVVEAQFGIHPEVTATATGDTPPSSKTVAASPNLSSKAAAAAADIMPPKPATVSPNLPSKAAATTIDTSPPPKPTTASPNIPSKVIVAAAATADTLPPPPKPATVSPSLSSKTAAAATVTADGATASPNLSSKAVAAATTIDTPLPPKTATVNLSLSMKAVAAPVIADTPPSSKTVAASPNLSSKAVAAAAATADTSPSSKIADVKYIRGPKVLTKKQVVVEVTNYSPRQVLSPCSGSPVSSPTAPIHGSESFIEEQFSGLSIASTDDSGNSVRSPHPVADDVKPPNNYPDILSETQTKSVEQATPSIAALTPEPERVIHHIELPSYTLEGKLLGAFIGEAYDRTPHGHGTLTLPSGLKYIGQWRHGKFNDIGRQEIRPSCVYEGCFKDHFPFGEGAVRYTPDDDVYKKNKICSISGRWGETIHDLKIEYTADFKYSCYSGSCVGRPSVGVNRSGRGTLRFRANLIQTCTGDWNGIALKTDSLVELVYTDGSIYSGTVTAVKDVYTRNIGKLTFSDGSNPEILSCDGEWEGNKLKKGTMIFRDGSSYEGEFVDGKYQGRGVLTSQNGQVIRGLFSNGLPVLIE